MFKTIDVT